MAKSEKLSPNENIKPANAANNLTPPPPPKKKSNNGKANDIDSVQKETKQASNTTPPPPPSISRREQTADNASVAAEYELCSWLLRLNEEQFALFLSTINRLSYKDFSDPYFASIYQIASKLAQQGKICGAASILDYAKQNNIAIQANDLSAIVTDTLAQYADNERINQNIEIILEHSQRRAMRAVLQQAILDLNHTDARDVGAQITQKLSEFSSLRSADTKIEHISEPIDRLIDSLNHSESDSSPVMATGFTDLDEALGGGLRDGNYIVIAARPSMGKTAFALNLARNVSLDTRHYNNVLFFSLEMSAESLASRLLSAESAVPAKILRKGGDDLFESEHYINSLLQIIPRFAPYDPKERNPSSRLWIDDQSGLTVSQISSRAREFINRNGKSLIIIDYLQFISTNDMPFGSNRVTQVSAISRELKRLAAETNCPVIVLSQLNRELEKRMDKRPIMSDLRESGAIEQDADLILFIYRDVVYNPDTDDPSHAELIIGKQRDGEIKVIDLNFSGQYVRFSDRAYTYET